MGFGQNLFRKFFVPLQNPQQNTVAPAKERVEQAGYSFGRLGEQGEQMAERIVSLTNRFEEIQALRDDFTAITKPLDDFLLSHSRAQTSLAKHEALLAQQIDTTNSLRRQLTELQTSSASTESEFTGLRHQIDVLKAQAVSDNETIAQLKSEGIQHMARMFTLEGQLSAEQENNLVLREADHLKGRDLVESERQKNESRAHVIELNDALAAVTSEAERLQAALEQLQPELVRARQRGVELETTLHTTQLNLHYQTTRMVQEQNDREMLQSKHAQEKIDLEASLAAMSLTIDGLNNRHATTLHHLDQTRALYNEKTQTAQRWELSNKEAIAARQSAERRLAVSEEQIRLLTEQIKSFELSLGENKSRGDMMSKAVSAKDVLVAQLQSKGVQLESRYATLAQELEREKSQNESAKRRLVEELENEKAERALAQGALAIARASREKMSARIEILKRARPLDHSVVLEKTNDENAGEDRETNVHPLRQ